MTGKIEALKKFREIHLSETGKEVVIQGVYFGLGILISRGAVFGTLSPFGGAFVAAVPFHNMLSSIAGCILGYLLLSPGSAFRYIAVLVAIGALRWVLGDIKKISSSGLFTPFVAFLPVFATGIALLFSDSSDIGSILSCFIEATIAGASAYFIKEAVKIVAVKRNVSSFSNQEISCIVMAGCILLLALSTLDVKGVSVGRILAITAVLFCGRYGGVTGGSIAGVATGVVFSLSSDSYTFISGGYGFGGMMAGVFGSMGKMGSVIAFFICSTMMSFSSNSGSIVLACAIETALASTIFMLFPSSIGNTVSSIFTPIDDINNGN
ncbi:MAG: stage II sporulation protein E, partial [Acutalibacteraceae bacterium]